jgi:phosphate uptake regulator
MKKIDKFTKEFNEITKIKIFEIPVTNLQNNESDFIIFDIDINSENSTFEAQRIGFNIEEENSIKIAFTSSDIDTDFSIDENLQDLYSNCIEDICNSEFFELSE